MGDGILEAIVLGIIQGIAEFLPISSSGHLVLAQELFGINATPDEGSQTGLAMNVALHVGTLFSIVVVYWSDLWKVARDWRVVRSIIIATLPVVIVGLSLKDVLERAFESPLVASAGLLVTASVLVFGQRNEHAEFALEEMKPNRALRVGLFQMFAIVPGVSRSGTTIAGGLTVGLSRQDAARFSFLIAIPAIGGAAVLYLKDLMDDGASLGSDAIRSMTVGGITSFVVGWVSLNWLLSIIAKGRLHYFAIYCAIAGVVTLVWQLAS